MARLYLDEDLGGFATALREQGHDVLSVVAEADRRGKTDAWHFNEAIAQARILLTWNKDHFQYLHRLWTALNTLNVVGAKHSGIVTADGRRGAILPADWIPVLRDKLASADPLEGRMWIWISSQRKWIEDEFRPED